VKLAPAPCWFPVCARCPGLKRASTIFTRALVIQKVVVVKSALGGSETMVLAGQAEVTEPRKCRLALNASSDDAYL
jgi:hypothetical protein